MNPRFITHITGLNAIIHHLFGWWILYSISHRFGMLSSSSSLEEFIIELGDECIDSSLCRVWYEVWPSDGRHEGRRPECRPSRGQTSYPTRRSDESIAFIRQFDDECMITYQNKCTYSVVGYIFHVDIFFYLIISTIHILCSYLIIGSWHDPRNGSSQNRR